MSLLDKFFSSEANQKKYGFEYEKDSSGNNCIYYDGDFSELYEIACDSLGLKKVVIETEAEDQRPDLKLKFLKETGIITKDSGENVTVDADGIGDEPNFLLRFIDNGKEVTIRFNMNAPEAYPDNDSLPYFLPLSSLSAINEMFILKCHELVSKWNRLRQDNPMTLKRIPNYRAINRIC